MQSLIHCNWGRIDYNDIVDLSTQLSNLAIKVVSTSIIFYDVQWRIFCKNLATSWMSLFNPHGINKRAGELNSILKTKDNINGLSTVHNMNI